MRPHAEELHPAPAPVEACARLLDLPYPLWLDSSAGGDLGRFSFFMAAPPSVFRAHGADTARADAPGYRQWRRVPGDLLVNVSTELASRAGERLSHLPPFQGGAAGFLGYDFGSVFEPAPTPARDDTGLPDALVGVYDWVIAWDHAVGKAWLITRGAEAEAIRPELLARLAGPPSLLRPPPTAQPGASVAPEFPVTGELGQLLPELRATFDRESYLGAVERVRRYILAGDIFQANLSQRFALPLREHAFAFYRRLRETNPAPFGAYFGTGDVTIASVSPERFLRLEGDRVETRPIKGTRPRGTSTAEDERLGRELAASAKDRAENVMIVDLMRNDLSRVCRPGSVRATALCALERHPTVHHLVSVVEGRLGPDQNAMALVRAAFPAGSITGAPKLRARQILAELEPTRRGVYCGSLGYLGADGSMDLSVAIRTCTIRGGQLLVHAGGGIVADSDPEAEYEETLAKARAILQTALRAPVAAAEVTR